MPGILTISLDLELYWGVRDKLSLEQYRVNLLGERQAVPALLELFSRYEIHATWAVVGFLFFESKSQLLENLPRRKPHYTHASLSPYLVLDQIGHDEHDDPYHYAPSLVRRIMATPHQELASHTFSHYYPLERGQTLEDFREDLEAALRVAQAYGSRPTTLVFPRNQTHPEYLKVCRELGFRVYRGNEEIWFYEAQSDERLTLLHRASRFLDTYFNIAGTHAYPLPKPQDGLINVPSSRFLRPYNQRLWFLEPLRRRRIVRSLKYAAETDQVYHLWWHPHNFGVNLEQNLAFLESVLKTFDKFRHQYRMQSLNMAEVGQLALEKAEQQALAR
ncbi:MAG: polysaccharide deacetylase family protein [Meiothermus sp.]|uniref:polysaccharide deacetylase family protein n=1 Tax=Meiothermus sp. TaxID=1955249 RepID=UPI00298F0BA4|nr:polysaccharide deacetylase family protein [Meiothermus sp.]MDW8425640.1 polysaccharide deacetylase family protein [Meiothermus sp.]